MDPGYLRSFSLCQAMQIEHKQPISINASGGEIQALSGYSTPTYVKE
jgi:hypothetical protein